VLTAFGAGHCENEFGGSGNKVDEAILIGTYVPSVGTEIKFTPQVPCSAVSGEVCIAYENSIDLSSFSTLFSAMT
jgi:hypothetical protein